MKQDNVLAVRDGRKKPFPRKLWDDLPEHKYGWTEYVPAEKPAVLQDLPKAEPQRQKMLYQPPPKAGEDATTKLLGILDFVNENKEKPKKPAKKSKKQ